MLMGYLVGGFKHGFYDFPFHIWDVILPNWRTHIVQDGYCMLLRHQPSFRAGDNPYYWRFIPQCEHVVYHTGFQVLPGKVLNPEDRYTLNIGSMAWYTSSTAQGGGGSFKNRKPIGEVGCCESGMAERSHWLTERWLELCLLEWLQWLQWSSHPQLLDVVWCTATVVVVVA